MAQDRTGGPAILQPDDLRALLAAPDGRTRVGRKHAAILAVLVGGGLRLSEARTLRGENVEHDAGRVRGVLGPRGWRQQVELLEEFLNRVTVSRGRGEISGQMVDFTSNSCVMQRSLYCFETP